MTNDTSTLNGALAELGELMADNLVTQGVTDADPSDGLTTLARKILNIPIELTITKFQLGLLRDNTWEMYDEEGIVACFDSTVTEAKEQLTVKNRNNQPVQGITVKFFHDETFMGSTSTTATGFAQLSYASEDVAEWPDEFVLSAVVEGTNDYIGCTKVYNTIIRENETTVACEDYVC